MSSKKKIYIVIIDGYCGGTVALTTLCTTLRTLGYDAKALLVSYFPKENISEWEYKFDYCKYMLIRHFKDFIKLILSFIVPEARFIKAYKSSANLLNTPNLKIKYFPFISKDSIVVYPEDVFGNPFNAKNVVRWLLYYYDYIDMPKAYNKSDIFIAYRNIFNHPTLNPKNYEVTIKSFNDNLYKQYNYKEREGVCYIIHKGKSRKDLPEKFDGPIIDSSLLQEDIVKIFNQYKYCYSYDPQTFYMKIAAVCGCIPILITEEGKSEKDYLGEGEVHYGVAYGNNPEQIQYAIDTRELFLKQLDYKTHNLDNANKLIKILTDNFGAPSI